MRGNAVVLAALLAPLPVAAQTGAFPAWLEGQWCGKFEGIEECIAFEREADGRIAIIHSGQAGPGRDRIVITGTSATVEDGRLMVRTFGGTAYREKRRGPDELVTENAAPENAQNDDARVIRYARQGNRLIIEFSFADGRKTTQRYDRATP